VLGSRVETHLDARLKELADRQPETPPDVDDADDDEDEDD
jgi:hypothetical protein